MQRKRKYKLIRKNDWYKIIKQKRIELGFSLRELGKEVKLSSGYLSQLENGKIEFPGYFTLIKVLDFLNIYDRKLFGE